MYLRFHGGTLVLEDVPGEVLLFADKPVIKDVLAAVERCALSSYDP